MIRSGRKVPTPAMPMPDFAVPYAAPIAIEYQPQISIISFRRVGKIARTSKDHCRSNATLGKRVRSVQERVLIWILTMPMKGANFGATSESILSVCMPDSTLGCVL